jgi:hypothetical protein
MTRMRDKEVGHDRADVKKNPSDAKCTMRPLLHYSACHDEYAECQTVAWRMRDDCQGRKCWHPYTCTDLPRFWCECEGSEIAPNASAESSLMQRFAVYTCTVKYLAAEHESAYTRLAKTTSQRF